MRLLIIISILLPLLQLEAQPFFQPYDIPADGQYSRGVAWGDLNGDGWPEMVVANEAPENHTSYNLIYWNLKGKGFRTSPLDNNHLWTEGIYLVDVDNDHDLDIFCSTQMDNRNQLYINDGEGNFSSVDAGDLTAEIMNSPGSCWCDFDLDGDLDAFVLGKDLEADELLENKGNLKFQKVQGPWNDHKNEARACVWGDFNGDGKSDIYVNNYVIRKDGEFVSKHRNYMYLTSDSGFEEQKEGDLVTVEHAGYGVSVLDLESDGDLDIYVSNISMSDDNNFYRNDGTGSFETVRDLEVATYLRRPSKGHFWADFNHDGLLDLYSAVGTMGSPVRYPEIQNYLFIQNPDSSFQRIYNDPSVMIADISAGTAGGDFDNDGDIDIVVGNWEEGNNDNRFYVNKTENSNWVKIRLKGVESNSYGIGSWVTVITSDGGIEKTQKRYHYPITGYGSMSEPIVHFGLGNSSILSSLEVKWPNGKTQSFKGVSSNNYYVIEETGELTTKNISE